MAGCPVDYDDSVEQKLIHPKLLPPIDPAPDRSQNRSQYFTAALEGDHLRKVSFSVPVVAGVPFIVPEYHSHVEDAGRPFHDWTAWRFSYAQAHCHHRHSRGGSEGRGWWSSLVHEGDETMAMSRW